MATTKPTRAPVERVASEDRTDAPKSLHTVKIVSILAAHLILTCEASKATGSTGACREAFRMFGMRDDWAKDSATFAKCVSETDKLLSAAK